MPIHVMLVDDSDCVHEAVKWVLKDEPYHLVLLKNPQEALKAVEDREFAVVIADQLLSEMSGTDFLKRVKKRSPNTMGIIMTAFVETKAAINDIRWGYVCQFLKKPLDSKRVKRAVQMAIGNYEIEVQIQKLLGYPKRSFQYHFPKTD